MKKLFYLTTAILIGALSLTACSDNDNEKNDDIYKDRSYGNEAMDACDHVVKELTGANNLIGTADFTTENGQMQEVFLRQVLCDLVDKVIVPTYTQLADDVESLEATLHGLTTTTITQAQIDKACADFKKARMHWERSEAFLMGAASDFSIDPTIDSWPLDRQELLDYFKGGMTAQIEEESSILGFHALEFILFRNGQNRKVAELQGNDTYTGFQSVSGADELKYAQRVCTLLKERCFQLQVAWEGETNAERAAVVQKAGLSYQTENGLSYGDNLKEAGVNSMSTFTTIQDAISQVLSDTEGSCVGIANEVGTAKIANPFSAGDIAYVESPYSYNSITDFQDNIRSIRNIWLGSLDGNKAANSFAKFFERVNAKTGVESAVTDAIDKIGRMPAPFVKYCSLVWGKDFNDPDNWESESE